MRVFLSGDNEFLCHMFGLCISVITSNYLCVGKHPCLWCLTKRESLRSPPNPLVPRTTDSICADYDSFVADGADLKKAKMHNNVVREPFFKDLPIEQVQQIKNNMHIHILMNRCPPRGFTSPWGYFTASFRYLKANVTCLISKSERKTAPTKVGRVTNITCGPSKNVKT